MLQNEKKFLSRPSKALYSCLDRNHIIVCGECQLRQSPNVCYRESHNNWPHNLCRVTCLMVRLLTDNLKKIRKKDDGLCRFPPIWPEPKERAREQPAQTEGRQTQTQEVGGGLQNLQVRPYRRQNDGWLRHRQIEDEHGGRGGRCVNDKLHLPREKYIWITSEAMSSLIWAHNLNAKPIYISDYSHETIILCL